MAHTWAIVFPNPSIKNDIIQIRREASHMKTRRFAGAVILSGAVALPTALAEAQEMFLPFLSRN
jgi:hypothetical protein